MDQCRYDLTSRIRRPCPSSRFHPPVKDASSLQLITKRTKKKQTSPLLLYLSQTELEIGLWTSAFAVSHIGMSAIRNTIVDTLGNFADNSLGLVGRPEWKLPDIWPGDEAGQQIFPTPEIAGRQLYRILYTLISFVTLGSAFSSYLQALHEPPTIPLTSTTADSACFWIAVFSWAISVTSLANPSPLSLVPVYETQKEDTSSTLGLQRKDAQKLQAKGMTRITRHPLILPVVSWAMATSLSFGGQPREWLFFGMLAMYAICGCYAQDLRVLKEEGSVGTVFAPKQNLQAFFKDTSFVPFGAVIDGRHSIQEAVGEIPCWAFVAGIGIGYELQSILLHWLANQSQDIM